MVRMLKLLLLFFALAVFLTASFGGFAQIASSPQRDRVLGRIDESEVITLAGNVHPLARAENDRGEVAPETKLERMVLVLKPSAASQRELDTLTEAQQEPDSPLYRRWLTPAEYGQRFGVSDNDLARIAGWLALHGFAVEPIPAGRRLILFSGTAGQVAEAFHTAMHRYEVEGRSHIANVEDPQIPKALAPVIAGVLSLHDFRRISATRTIKAVANPENTQGSAHYLFPADIATIYDLNPLYAAGKTGSGGSIAIVGRSAIDLNDVSSFRTYAGLPANQPAVILDGPNPGEISGDQDEATLDVEWAGGVAPGAAVKLVVAGTTATTDGVDLSAQYIVNHKTASVMSTSFGNCEAHMGTAEMAFYNSLWEQAASEGISSFVSSGDSGAAGCEGGAAGKGSTAAVNGLCSSPYSTCVGGTEFNEGATPGAFWGSANGAGGGSALAYIPEKVWNESASDGGSGLWASGGGSSGKYAQPSWQKGVSGAGSNGMRAVPDVSLTAAAHDGYLVCLNGNWYAVAGTSASSPAFAGILSIVDEKLGGQGQGNVNPALYGLLAANTNPFHATPYGNNSVPGVNGFVASGASYNLATGLGSVDANLLASAWPAAGGTLPQKGFSLKTSLSTVPVVAGKSATFTVTIAAMGGFNDAVALKSSMVNGLKVTFSPAMLKPGASSTVTVAAASGVEGPKTLTIDGTSEGMSESASVAIAVKAAASLSVSAPAKVTVPRGKTVTVKVSGTTGGSFSGTVTFAVNGLPLGVTASWSPATVKAAGADLMQATLTLKASRVAALKSANAVISASGEGLTSQVGTAVQVTPPAIVRRPYSLR
jgi:subtilase family serine protease